MRKETTTLTPEEGAKRILDYTRRSLGRAVSPLLPALYLLEDTPVELPCRMHTDGVHLYYHPETLVAQFKKDQKDPIRQLLHITLHGVMGHIGKARSYREQTEVFDRAADRNVRDLLRFFGPALQAWLPRSWWWEDERYRSLEEYLAEDEPEKEDLSVDDHRLWYAVGEEGEDFTAAEPGGAEELWNETGELVFQALNRSGEEDWGHAAGVLKKALRPEDGGKRSYRSLLEELCRVKEVPEEDPWNLDPILYQAGLDLLGDCPLVEPGEESERRRQGNLVVAVDTSGSCSGEVARRFLGESLQVLQSLGRRWRGKLAFLQCDCRIRRAQVLEDVELDPEEFMAHYTFQGGGGTSFCPIFRWVEKWQKETGEEVLGLLLFTDGWGDFPERAPDYPVVVLLDEEEDDGWFDFGDGAKNVPDWAGTYRLKEDLEL